ncbi:hypothetical protein M3Y97_00211500 [Aphelenchoides bicaudatus]|nr:hypothetical protein M3Y97_00211500 [Aphelenchoides bicaudatus]
MFKARNSDVVDLDKYKAVKRPDSEFKIEKVDGVDFVVLDSDKEENVENKTKTTSAKKNLAAELVPKALSMPIRLPSQKKMKQQNLFESLSIKRQPKPQIVSQPSTSKEIPDQTDEEKEKVERTFDRNGPKKRGPKGNRPTTPEPSEFIKSNPYFRETHKPQPKSDTQLSQYGFPLTPPRYWNIDFPSKAEQMELGLVVETESPLFKKRKI